MGIQQYLPRLTTNKQLNKPLLVINADNLDTSHRQQLIDSNSSSMSGYMQAGIV